MEELKLVEMYDIEGGKKSNINISIDVKISGEDVVNAYKAIEETAKNVISSVGKALHNTFGCTQCW